MRATVGGTVEVEGRKVRGRSPREETGGGIGLIQQARQCQGLVLDMSASKNMTLASLGSFTRMGVLDHGREAKHSRGQVDELAIKCSSVNQTARTMSGGNQQKLLLARWLTKNSKVLV